MKLPKNKPLHPPKQWPTALAWVVPAWTNYSLGSLRQHAPPISLMYAPPKSLLRGTSWVRKAPLAVNSCKRLTTTPLCAVRALCCATPKACGPICRPLGWRKWGGRCLCWKACRRKTLPAMTPQRQPFQTHKAQAHLPKLRLRRSKLG